MRSRISPITSNWEWANVYECTTNDSSGEFIDATLSIPPESERNATKHPKSHFYKVKSACLLYKAEYHQNSWIINFPFLTFLHFCKVFYRTTLLKMLFNGLK